MQTLLILFAASIALALADPAKADSTECLGQAEIGVQPSVWQSISNYFASLSVTDPGTKSKSRILELRKKIVEYEAGKERLIEIMEAHINGQTSAAGDSQRLSADEIPRVLDQIQHIIGQLQSLANSDDLFVTEKPFKDLVMTFDLKKSMTLCELRDISSAPTLDLAKAAALLAELKKELKAISDADDALGDYIKAMKN
jgi:hypothetical protein